MSRTTRHLTATLIGLAVLLLASAGCKGDQEEPGTEKGAFTQIQAVASPTDSTPVPTLQPAKASANEEANPDRIADISAPFSWSPVIAGLIGATAALAGVWLTQRAAHRQKDLDRRETRNTQQRDALVALIVGVEEWTRTSINYYEQSRTLIPIYRQPEHAEKIRPYTELGEKLSSRGAVLNRLLVTARLIITDDEVRPLVLELEDLIRGYATKGDNLVEAAQWNPDLGDDDSYERFLDKELEATWEAYRAVLAARVAVQEAALRRLT